MIIGAGQLQFAIHHFTISTHKALTFSRQPSQVCVTAATHLYKIDSRRNCTSSININKMSLFNIFHKVCQSFSLLVNVYR